MVAAMPKTANNERYLFFYSDLHYADEVSLNSSKISSYLVCQNKESDSHPLTISRQKKFREPKRRRKNIVTDQQFKYVIEFEILFPKILLKILYDEPFENYFFLLFFRIFVKIS